MRRLSARASLDDTPSALAHAQAQADAGDESWEQWVAEYRRGEALILRLELTLELADNVISASKDGFFVENNVHAPRVEQQIAELASGDLVALVTEAARQGRDIDTRDLGTMYVHVELAPDVRERVDSRAAPATPAAPAGARARG